MQRRILTLHTCIMMALVLFSCGAAYVAVLLTIERQDANSAQVIAAGFGPEMAQIVVSLKARSAAPKYNTGFSWRVVSGRKLDETTLRNGSETLFRLAPSDIAQDTPLLVRVFLQASALDAEKTPAGVTLAEQLSYLSVRIAALNTQGIMRVQISTSDWVEFSSADTWADRPTPVMTLFAGGAWALGMFMCMYLLSQFIAHPFTRISGYAKSLLNLPQPPQLRTYSGPAEARDIADALALVNRDLVQSIEDRTRFLTAISHDLRTPATRMQLRAELIEDPEIRGKLLSDLHEITAMINEAVGYLRDAVEQEAVEEVMILTFLESICDDYADIGKHVTFEKPDPTTVKSRGTIFAPQPAEYDIVCTRQTTLSCQPNRLRRAINNLIDNALKYGDLARVRVIADASTITVRVNDVGPGLTRDQMTRVFEPFYRAEGSRNRSSGGMGLGLPLAKSVVAAHGGRISLFNHDRCGLEVRITLPRHIGAAMIAADPM